MGKNNKPIDEVIQSLCPGISIIESNGLDEKAEEEMSWLYREWCKEKHDFVYLDRKWAQFVFLGKLPDSERIVGSEIIVGFCTLKAYASSDKGYGIAYMTHPFFEGLHVATSLITYAIDFARKNPSIDYIFASVIEGSISEKIIKHLGFEKGHVMRYSTRTNVGYTLRTP